jgi:hypothetical protein
VKQKKPIIVFLMETKLQKAKMESIRCKLGFENMFMVDSIGKSGGTALFWGEDISVTIQNFSQHNINGVIKNLEDEMPWKFTRFYGHPDIANGGKTWALFQHLAHFASTPWVCISDFNKLLEDAKKWGGEGRSNSQMSVFR